MGNMHTIESELNTHLSELRKEETELGEIQKKIAVLRNAVEESMIALGKDKHDHPNYTLSFRDNSPSHRMDWTQLQLRYGSVYTILRNEGILNLTPNKKPRSLVVTKVKVKQ